MLGLVLRSTVDAHLAGMGFSAPANGEAMDSLAEALAAGDVEPVVDSTYPLREVAAAIRYLASGEACGRVLLTV